jgi:hypothetical protein
MKLKDLFGMARYVKLEAITMLIDSIADDKAYDAVANLETDIEYYKPNKNKRR